MKCGSCGVNISGIMAGPGKCIACRLAENRAALTSPATPAENCQRCGKTSPITSGGICVECRIKAGNSDNQPAIDVPDYQLKYSKQPVAVTLRKCAECQEMTAVLTSAGVCLACEENRIGREKSSEAAAPDHELKSELAAEAEAEAAAEISGSKKRGRPAKK